MKNSVKKLMAKDIISTNPDETLEKAYEKLVKNKIRHLPVLDDCGDIIGIISDRDFQRGLITDCYDNKSFASSRAKFDDKSKVACFMNWPVETIKKSDSLYSASKKMIDRKISALIVKDGDDTVGILTHEDLLKVLTDMLSHQKGGLKERIERWAYNSPIGPLTHFFSEIGI